jgi:dimeric dUTPase (all-alpha-NTP-PPase superfamily)
MCLAYCEIFKGNTVWLANEGRSFKYLSLDNLIPCKIIPVTLLGSLHIQLLFGGELTHLNNLMTSLVVFRLIFDLFVVVHNATYLFVFSIYLKYESETDVFGKINQFS